MSGLVWLAECNCCTDDPQWNLEWILVLGVKFDVLASGSVEVGVRNCYTVDSQRLIVLREKCDYFVSGLVQVGV